MKTILAENLEPFASSSSFHFHLDCWCCRRCRCRCYCCDSQIRSLLFALRRLAVLDSICMNMQIVDISDRSTLTFAYLLCSSCFVYGRLQLNKIKLQIKFQKRIIKEKQTLFEWLSDCGERFLFFWYPKNTQI